MIQTIHHGSLSISDQAVLADEIDPKCHIALWPIRAIGRVVLYWALCPKGASERVVVVLDRVIPIPRVRLMPKGWRLVA